MNIRFIVVSLLLVGAISCQIPSESGDDILVEGKGLRITKDEFAEYLKQVPPFAKGQLSEDEILDRYVKSELLYLEALNTGLDREPEVKKKIDTTIKQILQREYYTRELEQKMGVDDDAVASYYEAHQDLFAQPEQRKCWHLLCKTREHAEAARQEIEGGVDFRDVAKRESIDDKTREAGGRLGIFSRGKAPPIIKERPALLDTLFALPSGMMSSVIESDLGYHVLKGMVAKRMPYKPLDEVAHDIRGRILVPDSLVQQYYDKNEDKYRVEDRARVRHLMVAQKSQAEELKERILQGEDMSALAKEHSIDEGTKRSGGLLGWVRREAPIKSIGENAAFEAAVWETRAGEIGPIMKVENGYSLFRVEERKHAGIKDLGEVESSIRSQLASQAKREAIEKAFEKMKADYQVTVRTENGKGKAKSQKGVVDAAGKDRQEMNDEELFALAQEEATPTKRLEIYREIVRRFPDGERADDSQFMMGFVLSEELGDSSAGANAYKELLARYPKSDWVDDAETMLKVLQQGEAAEAQLEDK